MACSPSRVRSRPREQPQQLENYFTLLVFPFSLYAIMVRLTVALGQSAYPSSVGELHIQHRLVNLHRDENISQEYLLTVNPKGQVEYQVERDDLDGPFGQFYSIKIH